MPKWHSDELSRAPTCHLGARPRRSHARNRAKTREKGWGPALAQGMLPHTPPMLLSRSRPKTHLVSACVATTALLVAGAARAQTVDIPGAPGTISREDASGKSVSKRDQANYPDAINYTDCKKDVRLRIPLLLGAFDTSVSLQVWAGAKGTDCSQIANRQNTTRQCWRVTASDVPRSQTIDAVVRVRDVIGQSEATNDQYVNASDAVCGKVDQTSFTVHFIWVRGGGEAASSKTLDIDADTVGPPALSGVKVGVGDTRLNVSWDSIGEAGTTNAQQVTVFYAPSGPSTSTGAEPVTKVVCDDAGADDGGDAAAITDANCRTVTVSDGSSSSSSGSCTAPGFNGTATPEDSVGRVSTGSVGGRLTIDGLQNGTSYAVAVGATDPYLNVGELSPLQCATPVLLDDFFETYKKAGGGAGGGFCSLEGAGAPAGSLALAVGLVGAAAALVRRRLRGNDRRSS